LSPKQHTNSLDVAALPQVGWTSGTEEQLSCLIQCHHTEETLTES